MHKPDSLRFMTPTRTVASTAILASLLMWWWIHQSWFMASDDYLAISRGGRAYGQFTATDWWKALAQDWYHRNGRTSDSLLRLVLRPGQWFYPLFAPAMITAAGIGTALLVKTRQENHFAGCRWVVSLCLIPALLWIHPPMAGDVVFWTAGAMNYLLPFTLIIFCLIGLRRASRTISVGETLGWCVLIAVTQSIHETAGLALVCSTIAAVLMLAKSHKRFPTLLMAASAAASFAFHMSAPGLWKRALTGDQNVDGLQQTVHFVSLAGAGLWSATTIIWLVLAGLLAALSTLPALPQKAIYALRVAAVSVSCFCLACAFYQHRAPRVNGRYPAEFPEYLLPQMVTVIATLGIAFGSVAVATFLARDVLGRTAMLSWSAFCGSSVLMLLAGMHERAQFIAIGLLGLTVLSLLFPLLQTSRLAVGAMPAVIVAASLALPAAMWCDQTLVQLPRNKEYVEHQVIPALQSAASGKDKKVLIPMDFPHPDLEPTLSFDVRFFSDALKVYYNIPKDTELHNY